MTEPRPSWHSNVGFLLAAVGSAVGLGNLWRFAYLASESGGAAFVLVYLAVIVLVGAPLLVAELAMGRSAREGAFRAPGRLAGRRLEWVGALFVLTGFAILSYYSVITGWTARYLVDVARGAVGRDTAARFAEAASGGAAVAWHLAAMALTVAIVAGGVRGGIERASLVLMPALFVLLIALAAWAGTLPDGGAGYAFYLRPDPARMWRLDTFTSAVGQAFFSLSLGMGAMLTYASYLQKRGSLVREGFVIALADSSVAFVGGLVTFPIVYQFGLQGQVGESTVGALFIALPHAFATLGATGQIVGTAFFLTLLIAALTSAISLLEVLVDAVVARTGWSRRRAVVLAGGATALAGVPAALDLRWLGVADRIAGNLLLVVGGLIIAILTGWIWPGADAELADGFPHPRVRRAWIWLLRVAIPAALALVLVGAVRDALGEIAAAIR